MTDKKESLEANLVVILPDTAWVREVLLRRVLSIFHTLYIKLDWVCPFVGFRIDAQVGLIQNP